MQPKLALRNIITAALLCTIGIIIPMFSPVKIILEPASFTLASHVPVLIAMFISPVVAIAVALGTSLGFLLGGFPVVIVFRALTHCVFALTGALVLRKQPDMLNSAGKSLLFSLMIGVLHGICEVLVVVPFYFGNNMSQGYYNSGFFRSVVMLVGVGTVIHSMIDLQIAILIWKPLVKYRERNTSYAS